MPMSASVLAVAGTNVPPDVAGQVRAEVVGVGGGMTGGETAAPSGNGRPPHAPVSITIASAGRPKRGNVTSTSLRVHDTPPNDEQIYSRRPRAIKALRSAGDLDHRDAMARDGRRRVGAAEGAEISVAPEIADGRRAGWNAKRAPLNGD